MSDENCDKRHLSTGLASLDGHLDGEGFVPGSVVALRAPARSIGRRVLFNLAGDRPIHYVAVGHDPSRLVRHLRTATGVDTDRTTSVAVSMDSPVESLLEALDADRGTLGDGTTVLIDPLTPIERRTDAETATVMGRLREILDELGGLGVVLAVGPESGAPPTGRWVTLSQADAVLTVVHTTDEDGVTHSLAVDRLPMGQRFREEGGSRCFELPSTLDLTLDTSKTLSP